MAIYLHIQIDAINPADGSTVVLRATNHNLNSCTALGGNTWLPVLRSVDDLEMRFFSGDFSGDTAAQVGSMRLRATSVLNDTWATYVTDGCRLQVWASSIEGEVPSDTTKIFDGLAGVMSRQLNEYSIEMKSPARVAENAVQTSTYAGTGGAEGPSQMKGKVKPYGIGVCKNVEPVLVDAAKQIYHVSTAATALTSVWENGISFNYSGTNYASYALMDAAAGPPQGEYTYTLDPSLGLFFRLGAEPAGLITCDFTGDLGGSATAGAAVKKLLDLGGMPAWRYVASRVTAFDTAVSNVTVNQYFTDEKRVSEAISTIMTGLGGYYGFDELGLLFMGLTRFGSSSATLDHSRTTEPVVKRMEQLPTSSPVWRLKLNAERVWRVHNSDEISDALKTLGNDALTAAQAAQADADAALSSLNNIGADGWLTRVEKQAAKEHYQSITDEYTNLVNTANKYSLTTLRDAYTTAKTNLDNYLATLSPAWNDTTQDTAITRSTWIGNWAGYYTARQNLVNELGADWENVVGDGRPADNAGTTNILRTIGSFSTLVGNTLTKSGGTHGSYEGGAVGTALRRTAFVSSGLVSNESAGLPGGTWRTTIALDTNRTTFGLTQTYLALATDTTNVDGNVNVYLYKDGVHIAGPTAVAGADIDSILSLVYDGQSISVLLDGNVILTKAGEAANQRLFPKVLDYHNSGGSNYSVRDIVYGPLTDSAWQNIGGSGKPSDNAGTTLTLSMVGAGPVTIQGNAAMRTGGSGWDTNVVSSEFFVGTAFVSGLIGNAATMLGLTDNPAGTSYIDLDYALYNQGGSWRIYESGGLALNMGLSYNGVTFSTSTRFAITYDGVKVRYYADGVLLREVATTAGRLFYAGAALATTGGGVSEVSFGPFSANDWSSTGGTGRPEDNATVGATWDSNLTNRPNNLAALVGNEALNNALVPAGDANRVRFGRMVGGTQGWQHADATASSLYLTFGTSGQIPYVEAGGVFTASNQELSLASFYQIPVVPGERIFVGAKTANIMPNSGCNTRLLVFFYDATGAVITANEIYNENGSTGFYRLTGGFTTVPANSRYAQIRWNARNFSSGTGSFSIYLADVHVVSATAEQTVHPPFAPGAGENMDLVAEGGIYTRPRRVHFTDGQPKLQISGSGVRVGDQRNLPAITAMNLGYKFTGAVSYTASAGTPATATISVTAGSCLIGSVSVAYNAMNVNVTGTGGTNVTYQLYVDDPGFAGGTKTLVATTSGNTVYQNDGRVWIGSVTVAYPTSGSGGGSGGGGGGFCVSAFSFVETRNRGWVEAWRLVPGDDLRVLSEDGSGGEWSLMESIEFSDQPQYLIRSQSGICLTVSSSTPMTLRDGSTILVSELDGQELGVFDPVSGFRWEPCFAEPTSEHEVAHVHVGGRTFLAGNLAGTGIFTHNQSKP